jgi:hypothetical protein
MLVEAPKRYEFVRSNRPIPSHLESFEDQSLFERFFSLRTRSYKNGIVLFHPKVIFESEQESKGGVVNKHVEFRGTENGFQHPGVYGCLMLAAIIFLALTSNGPVNQNVGAQSPGPSMTVPDLAVRTVVSDLVTPISMAFIGQNDFLLVEKNTGQVKRVVNGVVQGTVLDLGVNFASERGLLGIALHPNFPSNPGV